VIIVGQQTQAVFIIFCSKEVEGLQVKLEGPTH